MSSQENVLIQTQVNFINLHPKYYKKLVYSFNFKNNEQPSYGNFFQANSEQSVSDILKLIKENQKQLSKFRGHPVVAYLTAINTNALPNQIDLNDKDVQEFASLISDIPENKKEIDVVLHSYGGYIESAHIIIELLRNRFEKVNFLIPFAALSAASMMCMSADEIIMTPESSLSPFDVQVLSPDDSKTYLPANIMKKCAKEAKSAHNPLCIFMPKNLYEGWNGKTIHKTQLFCDISINQASVYPQYWLLKYMFKSHKSKSMLFWKSFSSDGRKANRIIKSFINIGTRFSHGIPIMYHDLKDTGLNISEAGGELLKLMRETYQLSDMLFQKSTIKKLYTSSESKSDL